ncbi:MAG TPA: ATP-dependent Clp protease adapter ClpS [Nitrospirae bacterium]|nr:ATP-dependent Clp protease adapter ClpS [Nitrospirota bacterium]HDO22509.1 ATP-dependent Clp protease adapter ClpS [Nitrospirota bacterium]HDZ88490.1 ATP-dependent Clp protease adapter ClpS [Nitrospirota bacterium]
MGRKGGTEVGERRPDTETVVEEKAEQKAVEPPLFKVYLLNDDYTTMEFVVEILRDVFRKNRTEATQIMLHVHRKGLGLCGIYTREIAETKVENVYLLARKNEFPLRCIMEKE